MDAHVLLTNTCAIRENAENKVWQRLQNQRAHDANYPLGKLNYKGLHSSNAALDSIDFPMLQHQARGGGGEHGHWRPCPN